MCLKEAENIQKVSAKNQIDSETIEDKKFALILKTEQGIVFQDSIGRNHKYAPKELRDYSYDESLLRPPHEAQSIPIEWALLRGL